MLGRLVHVQSGDDTHVTCVCMIDDLTHLHGG